MARIHVLGAGTPSPTPTRFGSSFVVEYGGQYIMVDCGPAATHKLVQAGLWPTKIDYLFFTHHHFDHDVDYPCFLLCRWDQSIGKENKLQVYGPTPTEEITEKIIGENGAFAHDWKARVNAPGSQRVHVNRGGTLPRKPPDVFVKDVGPGKVFSGSDWEVSAAHADHVQPYLDSLAYRLNTPEGSIVFTGDTFPCRTVTELAKDADVMLCICWNDQTSDAARMARQAGVKKLVLVHAGRQLSQPGNREEGIGDAKKVFDGKLVFSEELMTIDVP